MDYLRFIGRNWRLLGFGFVMSLGSSFGQTFFISLSSADIRAEFDLSHGEFGAVFTIATLSSGVCLVWAGRLIDRLDLRLFAYAVVVVMCAAMAALSVVESVVSLTVMLFLLRLCGQGLMVHTASTTMARYFDRDRGKALSVGLLGQPVGEAVLPLAAVGFIAAVGWRDAWLMTAAAMALVCAIVLPQLLAGQNARHREFLRRISATDPDGKPAATVRRQWTRVEVLRDSRFYFMTLVLLAFPFVGTGLFFHQVFIAELKGWSLELLATAFIGFAVMRVAASLVFGPVIDRFGASRLVTMPLVPLVLTLVALIVSDSPVVPVIYLAALGLSVGMLIPLLGALWTELYGALHIGSIKALSTAVIVLGSATSPALFGFLLDQGAGIEDISAWCLVYVLLSGVAVWHRFRRGMVEHETLS